MKRTTVVLTDELATLLEGERRRRDVSAAMIIREALDAYFASHAGSLPFVALGRTGHRHTARDLEELLAREWSVGVLTGSAAEVGDGDGQIVPSTRPCQPGLRVPATEDGERCEHRSATDREAGGGLR